MKIQPSLIDALHFRRSVRVYNPDIDLDTDIVKNCLKDGTLAPNSSNMQLYEFYHITSKPLLKTIAVACMNQNAAATAKQMVVVVVRKDLWKQRVKANKTYLLNLFGKKKQDEYSTREKFALNYYSKIMPFVYGDFLGIFGRVKYVIAWITGLFKPSYRQLRKSDMRVVAHKSAALAAQTFMLRMASEGYDTCPMEGLDSIRIKKALSLPLQSEINMVISCGIRKPEGIYGERFRIPFEEVYKKL